MKSRYEIKPIKPKRKLLTLIDFIDGIGTPFTDPVPRFDSNHCCRQAPVAQARKASISSQQSKRVNSERVKMRMKSSKGQNQVPLARVVSDCVRWRFPDTLKEAKVGDSFMQVLVGVLQRLWCS
ncbi:hypothetical protein ACFX14_032148 [Malus domestica]